MQRDEDQSETGMANSESSACVWPSRQKFSSLDPPGVIHREYLDRSAPNSRNTLYNRSSQAEMIEPTVMPRIK